MRRRHRPTDQQRPPIADSAAASWGTGPYIDADVLIPWSTVTIYPAVGVAVATGTLPARRNRDFPDPKPRLC
jgi:hypothetical protein